MSEELVDAPKEGMIKPQVTGKEKVRATLGRMRPGRDHLVDASFSVAIVACALFGLKTAIYGMPWIWAAGVGVLLGLVVGHVQATYRWPLVAVTVFGVVLHLLLGGPLAVRGSLRWGFLPTGQTFRDLVGGPIRGWRDLLTLVPPVDVTDRMSAMVLALALLGTTLTYVNARRTRSTIRLALPPLALLALVIALGTDQPASRWVQGVAVGVLLIAWASDRRNREQQRVGGGRPAISRMIAAVLLLSVGAAAAVAVGSQLPGTGAEREVLRTRVAPDHASGSAVSPLSQIRSYSNRDTDTGRFDAQLFQVDGAPEGTPLRLATLDSWDGSAWGIAGRSGDADDASQSYQQVGRRIGLVEGLVRPTTVTVEVTAAEGGQAYTDQWMVTTGRVEGIEFASGSQDLEGTALLNLSTNSAIVPPRLSPGDAYRLRTELPAPFAAPDPSRPVVEHGQGPVQISGDTEFLLPRLNSWSNPVDPPLTRLLDIAEAMHDEGVYASGPTGVVDESEASSSEIVADTPRREAAAATLDTAAGHSLGRLKEFVDHEPVIGDDEQFAATLALMGNELGIPTRVVVGARQTADGIIRGRDVHAWVEVLDTNGAWMAIPNQTFMPSPPPDDLPYAIPLGGPNPFEGEVRTAPVIAEPPPPPPARDAPLVWSSPSTWPLWLRLLVMVVGIPLVVIGLTPAVVAARRAIRWRRGTADQRIGRAWNDLAEEARGLSLTAPAGSTRVEQAVAWGAHADAVPAAIRADALIFGEGDPSADSADEWRGELRAVRGRIRRGAPLSTRLRATFDPRRLLSRHVDVGLTDASPPRTPGKVTR